MGSSYIARARDFVIRNPENLGINIGLQGYGITVRWFGRGGMRWHQLLHQLTLHLANQSPPDFLLLHVGANDIGQVMTHELEQSLKEDLDSVRALLPNCTLIWSSMLPRLHWRNVPCSDFHIMDSLRRRANRVASRKVLFLGGAVLKYHSIRTEVEGMYAADDVHLSESGLLLFCLLMKEGLKAVIVDGKRIFE